MKVMLRFMMVAALLVMGLGLISRTTISVGERWYGPMIQAGDISLGIGIRVARMSDGKKSEENQVERSCSDDSGDLFLVMVPGATMAVMDSAITDSREEW